MKRFSRNMSGAWLVIVVIAIAGCIGVFMVPGCFNNSDKPIPKLTVDTSTTTPPKIDYRAKWASFKQGVEEEIEVNQHRIVTLRKRTITASKHAKIEIGKDIDILEEKNRALDKRLEAYEDKGEMAWESFEREFSHDMKELGKALNDFAVDNVK